MKAMDRQRWAFPQVGVAAAKVGGETRIALDSATPLPRTAWKVDVARALVGRALAQLG